ncbi:MAG: hypothetical protein H6679_00295 [Epsilonproteobacteria bacterium]|nr:hypothetical protein [Campylobacterota bacterium]
MQALFRTKKFQAVLLGALGLLLLGTAYVKGEAQVQLTAASGSAIDFLYDRYGARLVVNGPVKYGDVVRLVSENKKSNTDDPSVPFGSKKIRYNGRDIALHHTGLKYGPFQPIPLGQVSGNIAQDMKDFWIVKPPHGKTLDDVSPESNKPYKQTDVTSGSTIRLTHLTTQTNLHSNAGVQAPDRENQQVATSGKDGIGDTGDNWVLEIDGGSVWDRATSTVKLKHKRSGNYLFFPGTTWNAGYYSTQDTGYHYITAAAPESDITNNSHILKFKIEEEDLAGLPAEFNLVDDASTPAIIYGQPIQIANSYRKENGKDIYLHRTGMKFSTFDRRGSSPDDEQVTASFKDDDKDFWVILPANGMSLDSTHPKSGKPYSQSPIYNDDVVRIQHQGSGKYLTSLIGIEAPFPADLYQIITTTDQDDDKNNFVIGLTGKTADDVWRTGFNGVSFRHAQTNNTLFFPGDKFNIFFWPWIKNTIPRQTTLMPHEEHFIVAGIRTPDLSRMMGNPDLKSIALTHLFQAKIGEGDLKRLAELELKRKAAEIPPLQESVIGVNGHTWALTVDDAPDSPGNKRVYHKPTDEWIEVTGRALKQIAVGPNGQLWGVNTDDDIYAREGITPTRTIGQSWTKVPGALINVTIKDDGSVEGLNRDDLFWVSDSGDSKNPEWRNDPFGYQPDSFVQTVTGPNGHEWGLTARREGPNYHVYVKKDDRWMRVKDGALEQLAVDANGNIWGRNNENTIFYHAFDIPDSGQPNWINVAGAQLTRVDIDSTTGQVSGPGVDGEQYISQTGDPRDPQWITETELKRRKEDAELKKTEEAEPKTETEETKPKKVEAIEKKVEEVARKAREAILSEAKTELGTLTASRDARQASVTTLEGDVKAKSSELKSLEAEIKREQARLDGLLKTIEAEEDKLGGELDKLNEALAAERKRLGELEGELKGEQAKLSQAQERTQKRISVENRELIINRLTEQKLLTQEQFATSQQAIQNKIAELDKIQSDQATRDRTALTNILNQLQALTPAMEGIQEKTEAITGKQTTITEHMQELDKKKVAAEEEAVTQQAEQPTPSTTEPAAQPTPQAPIQTNVISEPTATEATTPDTPVQAAVEQEATTEPTTEEIAAPAATVPAVAAARTRRGRVTRTPATTETGADTTSEQPAQPTATTRRGRTSRSPVAGATRTRAATARRGRQAVSTDDPAQAAVAQSDSATPTRGRATRSRATQTTGTATTRRTRATGRQAVAQPAGAATTRQAARSRGGARRQTADQQPTRRQARTRQATEQTTRRSRTR